MLGANIDIKKPAAAIKVPRITTVRQPKILANELTIGPEESNWRKKAPNLIN